MDGGLGPRRSEAVERLLRWQEAGGVWRLLVTAGPETTVLLLSCDGGSEMDRVTSDDPAFVAFVSDDV